MPAQKMAENSQKKSIPAKPKAASKKTAKNQNAKPTTQKSIVSKSKTTTSKKTVGKSVLPTKKALLKKATPKKATSKKATSKKVTSKKVVTKSKQLIAKTISKKTTTKKTVSKPASGTSTKKELGTKNSSVKKTIKAPSKQKQITSKKTSPKKNMIISNKTASKSASSKSKVTKTALTKKSLKKPSAKKTVVKKKVQTLISPPKKTSATRIVPTAPRVKLPEFPTTKWGSNLVIHFEVADQLPPAQLTSIAGGIVFHEEKVVLANVPGRGWEIIGGRIDLDEDPEVTFRRETHNQLGITLSHAKMLGLMRIEHKGPMPPNCPYPYPIAYGIQYIGIMDEMLPFEGSVDSLGRSLITMDGLPEHYYGWNPYHEAVFQYAFDEYQKWRKKLK